MVWNFERNHMEHTDDPGPRNDNPFILFFWTSKHTGLGFRRRLLTISFRDTIFYISMTTHPVSFLQDPSRVKTVTYHGTRIWIGYSDGSVIHVHTPYLDAPHAGGRSRTIFTVHVICNGATVLRKLKSNTTGGVQILSKMDVYPLHIFMIGTL